MLLTLFLIFCIVSLILSVYLLGIKNEQYWKKRGVQFYERNKAFGIFWDFFVGNGALFEELGHLYHKYRKEPAVGIGAGTTRILFIIDQKNIQHVLVENFSSFSHRGVEGIEGDQLADNIIFLNGPKWKLVRDSMTPLFTSSKLKNMFNIMNRSALDFIKYIKNNPKKWEGDCFKTSMTFCNAAACATIFGINSESIFDSPFLNAVEQITAPTLFNNMNLTMLALSPTISRLLGLKMFPQFKDFFVGAVKRIIQERKKGNIESHEFADICISIQNNGVMKDPVSGYEVEPTYELFTAQAMFFLVGGVEPVASLIFNTFVELGDNPDILKKVHEEVDRTFEKHGDNLTFDIVSGMTYVDKVLTECMRKNPPIGFLTRECIKDSVLPVGNIKVEVGTKVFTPLYHVHHDPHFYPDPHVFNPERFAEGTKLSSEIFMPFGLGNRMCFGARFSKFLTAAGVVHFLRHFTVRTKELGGAKKFKKHLTSVRRIDVDVEFIPRNQKTK